MVTIKLRNSTKTLGAADLIQAGGEGLVFDVGNEAVKIYSNPTPTRQAKLAAMLTDKRWLGLPANFLAPIDLAVDLQGNTIGFAMPKLPANAFAAKQFANPNFTAQKQIRLGQIVDWLLAVFDDLTQLHQRGIVIGDLNDHNLFCAPNGGMRPFWIDVDSYQFRQFPCPVAIVSFLDPRLYAVSDFKRQPVFSPASDWYAFAVLAVKCLLQTHPYGGAHHRHKSLPARTAAKIPAWRPEATYPVRARSPAILSDELNHFFDQLFSHGIRSPFPVKALAEFRRNVTDCRNCGSSYWAGRNHCPECRQKTPAPQRPSPGSGWRQIFSVEGIIRQIVTHPTGRISAIVQQGERYCLTQGGVGGILKEQPLFAGNADYRIVLFADHVAINQPAGNQLHIFSTSDGKLSPLARLETATWRNQAVFAGSRRCLFRIANGMIMRGEIQYGHYVEEPIAAARPNQTQLWGDPNRDRAAGGYRLFGETHYFLLDSRRGELPLALPPPPLDSSLQETMPAFGKRQFAILQRFQSSGNLIGRMTLFNQKGERLFSADSPDGEEPHWSWLSGKLVAEQRLLMATDAGLVAHERYGGQQLYPTPFPISAQDKLHWHPAGLLLQTDNRLWLKPND